MRILVFICFQAVVSKKTLKTRFRVLDIDGTKTELDVKWSFKVIQGRYTWGHAAESR